MIRKLALAGACSALALALGGCGSDSSPAAPATALSGTAATGAPIAGATVVIRCAGGSDITATTDAAGGYSVTVPDMTAAGATMPCALEVTLPDLSYLYGLAEANGTANITPLTNLAVAQAVGGSPDAWFAAGDSVALTFPTTEEIAAARTAVETALEGATGEATVPFNIFTEPFDAGSTDAYDVWLDQFNAALTADGTAYDDLVTAFVGGGGFGTITIDVTTPAGGGTGSSSMNVKLYMNGSPTPASDLTFVIDAAAPTSQAEFCDATTYIDPADYTAQGFAITGCSFSGGTGTITGTITSGPATYPFRQDITWT